MPPTGPDRAAPPRYRSRAIARAVARVDRGPVAGVVAVGDVSDRLHQLGPLYLMMAAACVAVSPLSGVPFVTTACGLSIAAMSAQLLLGRRTAWLPKALRARRVRLDRLRSGLGRADRVAGVIEGTLRRRWVWLTRGPARAGLLSVCLIFGLTMPFLEIIPFAGTTLASVVLIITLALIARDGVAASIAALAIGALPIGLGALLL